MKHPEEEKKGTPPLRPLPSYNEIIMGALDTLRLHAPMEFNPPYDDRDKVKSIGDGNPFVISDIQGDTN